MSAKFFLDTNIFVYSFDARQPVKQKKAQALIDKALTDHTGVVSYQVVQEFLNVALRKFEKPLTVREARSYLDDVLDPLCDVFPTVTLYQRALDMKSDMSISFYDALIVASACQADCKIIYTEDLQDTQQIDDLTIRNPFA
jgi:predicted nucleic acid-binding protein